MSRRTPNDIKLGIAERKLSRLRRENKDLKDRMNGVRRQYVELLKALSEEPAMAKHKSEFKKIITVLEAQDDE